MYVLNIYPTDISLLETVQTDSQIPFVILPDVFNKYGITIKFPDEKDFSRLFTWLQSNMRLKTDLTGNGVEENSKYKIYNAVYKALEPDFILYLVENINPDRLMKFTDTAALDAELKKINTIEADIEKGLFYISAGEQVAEGIITPDHVLKITLTSSVDNVGISETHLITLPAKFNPPLIRLFISKYLTDRKYRFAKIKKCMDDFTIAFIDGANE